MSKGFLLIEVLLVTSIIIVLGAVIVPGVSRFLTVSQQTGLSDQLTTLIRKTQEYAMDGKDNQTWGFCLSGSTLMMYSGSCLSPQQKQTVSIPVNVQINGVTDTQFNQRGEPSNPATITILSNNRTSTISLNTAGGLSVY